MSGIGISSAERKRLVPGPDGEAPAPKPPRFWEEINRLGAQDGDILTDGTRRWQYHVKRCGCQARLEEIREDGQETLPVFLSARIPAPIWLEGKESQNEEPGRPVAL